MRDARLRAQLNWTPCHKQYTATIDGTLHRLGTDQAEAEKQFHFLLTKADLAEPVKAAPTFGEVVDEWLEHVHQTMDKERVRLCKGRVNEFLTFHGREAEAVTDGGCEVRIAASGDQRRPMG